MTLDMMAAQKGSLQAWEAADRLALSWCLGPGLGELLPTSEVVGMAPGAHTCFPLGVRNLGSARQTACVDWPSTETRDTVSEARPHGRVALGRRGWVVAGSRVVSPFCQVYPSKGLVLLLCDEPQV